ncbi:hypothetical protein C4564_01375 [Candidatus Microgenomates bacterium]|nr:MAG: hypothetical protein C4564_01375 [Candidatus Microgenomates bacterium]
MIRLIVSTIERERFIPGIDLLRFELPRGFRYYTDVLIVDDIDSATLYFRASSKQAVLAALDVEAGFAPVPQEGDLCYIRVLRPAGELETLFVEL